MRRATAIFALLLAAPAFAQQASPPSGKPAPSGKESLLGKHDSSAPVHISADNFNSDVKTKNGDYVGNVVVTQGDMQMRADRMHFDTKSGDLSLITATSNVVVVSRNGTATGDHGVYDLDTHLITMTGRVVLTKQKDVMRGTKLVMDTNTNLAHLTADSSQNGRVNAEFIPKQHPEKPANTSTKPADGAGK